MKLIRYLWRTSKASFLLSIFIGLFAGFSSSLLIALVSRRLTAVEPLSRIYVATFIGLLVAVIVLDLSAKWFLIRLTATASSHLSIHLCSQVLVAPYRMLEEIGSPRLLAAYSDDLRFVGVALGGLPTVITNVAIAVGCLGYLLWLFPPAFVGLLLFAVPVVIVHYYLNRKAKRSFGKAFAFRDRAFFNYRVLTEGIKELKLHRLRRDAFVMRLLNPTIEALHREFVRGRTLYAVANSWSQAVYFLFILGLFYIVAYLDADIRVLTGYAVVALYMRGSILAILNAIPAWSTANVALERLERLGFSLAEHAEETGHDEAFVSVDTVDGEPSIEIRLEGVTHRYFREVDERNFTLGPIDLELQTGELVFLTGPNGSGKTTLAKLLTGLYLPEEGSIYINDQLVTAKELEGFRQHFTVVFSDSFVFEELLGVEQTKLDHVAQEYLGKLELAHKVTVEQGKLSTTDLSQGQGKRLSLLVAYLEDRPIYLFDEWAASQDPMFKELFYRTLLPDLRKRGKLVVVISHDDHYYDVADRIIKIDYGQIEYDIWQKDPEYDRIYE